MVVFNIKGYHLPTSLASPLYCRHSDLGSEPLTFRVPSSHSAFVYAVLLGGTPTLHESIHAVHLHPNVTSSGKLFLIFLTLTVYLSLVALITVAIFVG